MTDRDTTTRTRARAPGAEDYPPSKAVHHRVHRPDSERVNRCDHEVHEGRKQTGRRPAHAGSRLKRTDVREGPRLTCQPSNRTGENPPYGMIGGIEETSRIPLAYRDPQGRLSAPPHADPKDRHVMTLPADHCRRAD